MMLRPEGLLTGVFMQRVRVQRSDTPASPTCTSFSVPFSMPFSIGHLCEFGDRAPFELCVASRWDEDISDVRRRCA